MIRSRSTLLTGETLAMTPTFNENEKEVYPATLSPTNSAKSPVGSKILKLLLFVSSAGIFAYLFIFVGTNPIKSKIKRTRTAPENFEKLTVVMNTFKRNDYMTGMYSSTTKLPMMILIWIVLIHRRNWILFSMWSSKEYIRDMERKAATAFGYREKVFQWKWSKGKLVSRKKLEEMAI